MSYIVQKLYCRKLFSLSYYVCYFGQVIIWRSPIYDNYKISLPNKTNDAVNLKYLHLLSV